MTDIMIDTPLDGIVATNATTSKVEFLTPTEEVKQVGRGAVSGSPLTRRAIEVVERIHRRCNGTYPIIGVGGIMSSEDAQAMLRAGASLIQVHTGLIYNGAGFVGDLCRSLISETEEASAGNSDKS